MAATNLFVNVNAGSIAQGLVRGLSDNTPVSLPEIVLGDTKQFNLFFIDGQGNYAPFSGSASYIPYLAFGGCGQPGAGTFTLTSPNGAQTTGALAWNAPLATVQAALQGLSSIGAGNVLVTGVPGVYYLLTFAGSLASQPVLPVTGSAALLTPASNLDISTITPGTTSPAVSCVQMVYLTLNPFVLVSNWTPITNGWTGTFSGNTAQLIAAFISGNQTLTDIFQITLQDPSSNMMTYVQTSAVAVCSIINLHAFAAAVNPVFVTQAQLAAAVLGANTFTRQDLTATTAGNTNVTPQTTSRNHSAVISFAGASAGTYTVSVQRTNSPVYGDQVFLTLTNLVAGLIIQVYDASTGGTQLLAFTVGAVPRTVNVRLGLNSTPAWEVEFGDSAALFQKDNLAGLNSTLTSKVNLKSLFNALQNKTGNYSQVASDEGTILRCSAASGSFVVTLLAPATAGAGFLQVLQKTDASSGAITTSPATATLNKQNQLVILESDGSAWQVILNTASVGTAIAGQLPTLTLSAVTQLVGGTSACLDAIPTAGGLMASGQVVEIVYPAASPQNQLVLRYRFRAGTDAAVAMFLVRPTDFNAGTNAFVYELLSVSMQTWPCLFNPTTGKFNQVLVTGAAGSEALQVAAAFNFS